MSHRHVPRRRAALAAVALSALALIGVGSVAPAAAVTSTPRAAPGDRYVSNPPQDRQLVGYCADQAQLANNLEMQGDHDRAVNVVGAANIRGCRIYTFQA